MVHASPQWFPIIVGGAAASGCARRAAAWNRGLAAERIIRTPSVRVARTTSYLHVHVIPSAPAAIVTNIRRLRRLDSRERNQPVACSLRLPARAALARYASAIFSRMHLGRTTGIANDRPNACLTNAVRPPNFCVEQRTPANRPRILTDSRAVAIGPGMGNVGPMANGFPTVFPLYAASVFLKQRPVGLPWPISEAID